MNARIVNCLAWLLMPLGMQNGVLAPISYMVLFSAKYSTRCYNIREKHLMEERVEDER